MTLMHLMLLYLPLQRTSKNDDSGTLSGVLTNYICAQLYTYVRFPIKHRRPFNFYHTHFFRRLIFLTIESQGIK